ncbi:RIO1 family regulatory kinase/ATPase domain-containing protein [Sorangium sp. So ce1151]|uniref:RIO1 family regulatory kinase/ATPase domain-containing protein n=1 Tax=Sorangium sp. So ce1151 TaxID=3133332 RepID=UPI003F5DAD65
MIIDFHQSVDAAQNQNAKKLLLRDVDNLHRFLTRFVLEQRRAAHGEEMWELYANGAERRLPRGPHSPSTRRGPVSSSRSTGLHFSMWPYRPR